MFQGNINGFKVFVKDPYPVYVYQCRYKKHRKKRNVTPRVKVFSHWNELLGDGQIIKDEVHNAIYMNRVTFIQFKSAIAS